MPHTLEVIKVKAKGFSWAIKATMDGVVRYRGFYYKKEAQTNLHEWENYVEDMYFEREFKHNFHSAKELGIEE
jgi:hypothetical protein